MTRGAIKYGNAKFGEAFKSGDPMDILASIGSIIQDPLNANGDSASNPDGWGLGINFF